METDKDGNQRNKIEYCVDCLNFKTIRITEYNLPHFFFGDNSLIKKYLDKSDLGKIRIYYCKKSKTSQAVYFSQRGAYALTSNTCEQKEYDT